jgi:ribonuclease T2
LTHLDFFRGRLFPTALVLAVLPVLSSATVPLKGRLQAERDCPLYVSIKKGTNPDGARLVPGTRYQLLGKNKEDASHYRVRVEGVSPAERWVEVDCGRLTSDAAFGGAQPVEADKPGGAPLEQKLEGNGVAAKEVEFEPDSPDAPSPPGRFVLAASWQPAFCELRGRRPECRPGSTDARKPAFSLHGLWPQAGDRGSSEDSFCGVSERSRDIAERGPWSRLPALDLENVTRARLEAVMPGTESNLHRYQWTKHGSCYGTGPDSYFRHSAALMDQLNASAVRELFARNLGRHLSARDIRGAFDKAFGDGAGKRVRVRCTDGMVTELQIGLRGRVSESVPLSRLIQSAKRRSAGCRGGRIDLPGVGR